MKVPEEYRIKAGLFASSAADGNNGAFYVPLEGEFFNVVASDGLGWEHVSISLKHRTPTWEEMCFFKELFWGEDELVMQLHPPKSDYVNNHNFCLHLWKPTKNSGFRIPQPPGILVGDKSLNIIK